MNDEQAQTNDAMITLEGEDGNSYACQSRRLGMLCKPPAYGLSGVEAALIYGNLLNQTRSGGRAGGGGAGGGTGAPAGFPPP